MAIFKKRSLRTSRCSTITATNMETFDGRSLCSMVKRCYHNKYGNFQRKELPCSAMKHYHLQVIWRLNESVICFYALRRRIFFHSNPGSSINVFCRKSILPSTIPILKQKILLALVRCAWNCRKQCDFLSGPIL